MRMKERSISQFEVKKTIQSPEKHQRQGSKHIAMGIRNNQHLLIVYYAEANKIVRVITVITTSKTSKYLNDA